MNFFLVAQSRKNMSHSGTAVLFQANGLIYKKGRRICKPIRRVYHLAIFICCFSASLRATFRNAPGKDG